MEVVTKFCQAFLGDEVARGPMVFNERVDYFAPGGRLKSVDWQDFTIAIERA